MTCENSFCIYWSNHQCLLDTLELDEMGCCRSCITVHLEADMLEAARTALREKFERRDNL